MFGEDDFDSTRLTDKKTMGRAKMWNSEVNKLTRYSSLVSVLLAVSLLPTDAQQKPAALRTETAQAKLPNIVFIMSDDHAAHAISAYGSKIIKTPNIDRLAKEGMRFDNCFRHQLDLHAEPGGDPHRQVRARQRRARLQPLRRLPADAVRSTCSRPATTPA